MTSLRGRLFAAIGLAVLLSVGLTLVLGSVLTRRSVEDTALANLARQADVLAAREEAARLPPRRVRRLNRLLAGRQQRLVLVPLERAAAVLPDEAAQAVRDGRSVEGSAERRGDDVLYAARPVGDQALVLFRPARLRFADWRPFAGSFVVAGVVGAGLAALVAFGFARAIARPLKRVADASRAVGAGTSPAPLPTEGPDELAALARSFNIMSAELARARDAERTFLLSVGHELKTPLTAIRGYAEGLAEGAVAPEEAAEVVEREARRLERLVRDLLDLARINQTSFSTRREPVDLADVAKDAVRRYTPFARTFDVGLEATALDGAPARGDPDRLVQIASNLVENALRCTPAGGSVRVAAEPGTLTVSDTGPGLEADALPRAFERFFLYRRYEDERPVGTGLGLAIVKELTEAMGGSVSVESTPGAGTTFTVRLPSP